MVIRLWMVRRPNLEINGPPIVLKPFWKFVVICASVWSMIVGWAIVLFYILPEVPW